jgi:hypothetical protein
VAVTVLCSIRLTADCAGAGGLTAVRFVRIVEERREPEEDAMAKETLHVELESDLVERVRRYSEEQGTDVAGTIGGLIASLPPAPRAADVSVPGAEPLHPESKEEWIRQLPPLTRSLLGIGAGDADEEDYRDYLWRKYGP